MREETLLPCPACGGSDLKDPTEEWLSDAESHWVTCYDCGCCGPCDERSEIAVHGWNALPRALRWTKELPKEAGWYWWKDARDGEVLVAWVFTVLRTYARLMDGNYIDYEIEKLDGEWAGPIPEPKEK